MHISPVYVLLILYRAKEKEQGGGAGGTARSACGLLAPPRMLKPSFWGALACTREYVAVPATISRITERKARRRAVIRAILH